MKIELDSYHYPHFTDGKSKAQREYSESCPSKWPLHILFPSALLLLLPQAQLVLEPFYLFNYGTCLSPRSSPRL